MLNLFYDQIERWICCVCVCVCVLTVIDSLIDVDSCRATE